MAAFKDEIQLYFDLGLAQKEILSMLAHYQKIIITDRHLRRILRTLKLYRRKHYSDILEVAVFIENQLSQSGQLHGYRWMHMKCLQKGLVVSRETIRILLQILDPKGVECRLRRRLNRRRYLSRGPDYTWHVDSYDKLKQYGLCVNGCIDGFSHYIIWLECYRTSSDPKIVAGYFINAIESGGGCPLRIRGDRGTENGHVAAMQNLIVGENSFIYGSSTSNTRIESWWSILRKEASEYWIRSLAELKMDGHFVGTFLDVNLMQFCCMEILQEELNEVVSIWNAHRIRKSKFTTSPAGHPMISYYLPELYRTRRFMVGASNAQISTCKDECLHKTNYPCDMDIFQLCIIYMQENAWVEPNNLDEALKLYRNLRQLCHEDLFD